MTETLTDAQINAWADDPSGPVALHLKQELLPVEGEGGVIFPPTYADIGYNIDTLSDGTKVATVDSVGSQANRIEPIFKEPPYADLVPQIEIVIVHKDKETGEQRKIRRSIFDLAHRGADATVLACPTLAGDALKAFRALRYDNDAGPLVRLFPTSLVFGVWDSRGGTSEKRPRLVRSIIRAWNVEELHAAAQFNSIIKSLDDEARKALEEESNKKGRKKLSDVGLDDAPAIFRKVSTEAEKHMLQFKNGSPNPERRVLGGIVAKGPIVRDVTVNLIALRRLSGSNDQETRAIRRYLLALALLAATADSELYLREGCLLRMKDEGEWKIIPRYGEESSVALSTEESKKFLLKYAQKSVEPFKASWPERLVHKFDLKAAKALLVNAAVDDGN